MKYKITWQAVGINFEPPVSSGTNKWVFVSMTGLPLTGNHQGVAILWVEKRTRKQKKA